MCAAQFVPDSLCTVDTLHWEPNPDMQARHAAVLNDRNAIQLEAAKRFGLRSPLPSREGAEAATAGLTRIESCDAYTVDSLEYSIPFLTTAAEALVRDIGGEGRISTGMGGMEGISFFGVLAGTIAASVAMDCLGERARLGCLAGFSEQLPHWL